MHRWAENLRIAAPKRLKRTALGKLAGALASMREAAFSQYCPFLPVNTAALLTGIPERISKSGTSASTNSIRTNNLLVTTETEKGLFGRILGTGRGRNRRAAEANAAVQSSIAGSPGELHTIRRTANRTRGCERLLNPRPVDLRSFRLRSIRL